MKSAERRGGIAAETGRCAGAVKGFADNCTALYRHRRRRRSGRGSNCGKRPVMAMMNGPVLKDVVLVGAGHAHVQVLRRFGMKPLAGVRFTLITREVHTPYSGMLPGLVAGIYGFDDVHIDTGPLARFAHARLYQSAAIGIDLAGRRVICDNRPPVPYDLLSINTGSTPNTDAGSRRGRARHPGQADRPISWATSRRCGRASRRVGKRRIALVGAGPGGVELLLALEHSLRHEARRRGASARLSASR